MGLALKSLFSIGRQPAPAPFRPKVFREPEVSGVPFFTEEVYRGVKLRFVDLATCHVAEAVVDGVAHQEIVGLGEREKLVDGFHGFIDSLLEARDDRRLPSVDEPQDGRFPRLYGVKTA